MLLLVPKVFPPYLRGFLAKNQKVFKIGNYDEETEHFEKETLFLSKNHLHQNGKAQNIPVVSGRLVFVFLTVYCCCTWLMIELVFFTEIPA